MSRFPKFLAVDAAVAKVQELTAAKAEAQARITNNLNMLAEEKTHFAKADAHLKSAPAEPMAPGVKEYWIAAKIAGRAGIKACKLSIFAYQQDIDACQSEIDEIVKRVPEARLDN